MPLTRTYYREKKKEVDTCYITVTLRSAHISVVRLYLWGQIVPIL